MIPNDPIKRPMGLTGSGITPQTKVSPKDSSSAIAVPSDQFQLQGELFAEASVKGQASQTLPATETAEQVQTATVGAKESPAPSSIPNQGGPLVLEETALPEQTASQPLVADYKPADTLQDVLRQGQLLPQIARSAIATDVCQALGGTAEDMKDLFQLDDKEGKVAKEAHAFAYTVLDDLAGKVLGFTAGGEFHGLDPERMSVDRLGDATAQHVGYAAGVLGRDLAGMQGPGREISRILLRSHFEGKLAITKQGGEQSKLTSRELLARELGKVSGDAEAVKGYVNSPDQDYLFSTDSLHQPGSLLPNIASYQAGEATLQFASKLMGGDDKRAESFVKHVFSRPGEEIKQMLRDPQGLPGALVSFAAVAHHQAWEWSKLGGAVVAAKNGDEGALKKWNHHDIGPTRKVVVEDLDSAAKIGDQIESYLLREGKLVPCEREAGEGNEPLAALLSHIEQNGIYGNGSGNLRIVGPEAKAVKGRLWSDIDKAARLSDWHAGNELAGDVVAHTCASFAAQAVKADFQKKDELVSLYRDAIDRFSPQLDKLLEHGPPEKGDAAYKAFFQELAGEFGFEALKKHMGVGKAHDLVRQANIANLIPIACDSLRLKPGKDFTPENIVADIAELKTGLLKGDYFLEQQGFVEGLQAEAKEPAGKVDRTDLENGIRIPNAVWMWTQLTRGLVENKPGRYSGGEADMSSDQFPSSVQFSPPDVRDVELFVWARHRLSEAGQPPGKATRMALATVVLTLYKDLLQLRQAA